MRGVVEISILIFFLPTELMCTTVTVPKTAYNTGLFASVTLRCDYSTSANPQDVLVTWKYKSFCMDPILNYYSSSYQAALQLGQDPADNCPDSQRTIRVVAQKKGASQATLGPEYSERKISIQNAADLVISEVMWWDNGVYLCIVDGAGDTSGDNDKEVKLIVYSWLTVLFMIIGALILIMLFCICCCQCCPQHCCCYIRCPCCPQKCCCPEKLVMQHRFMQEAQKAMNPWLGGQPLYAPLSHASTPNPMMYSGSVSGKSIAMQPMPLPPPHSAAYSMPPPSVNGHAASGGTNQMLDYLENQVRGLDMASPMLQPQPGYEPHPGYAPQPGYAPHQHLIPPPPQHMSLSVPFSPGPPSMLSALDDRGPNNRRVNTLGRVPPAAPKSRPPSSSESSRSGYAHRRDDNRGTGSARRYPSPTRSRGEPRSYSEEDLDGRSQSRAHQPMGPPRSRSRSQDDLLETRSRGNYSIAPSRRSGGGSWSSDEDSSLRGGRGGRRGGGWADHPPSYTEFEPGQKPRPGRSGHYSVKSSRSGTSVVI